MIDVVLIRLPTIVDCLLFASNPHVRLLTYRRFDRMANIEATTQSESVPQIITQRRLDRAGADDPHDYYLTGSASTRQQQVV